MIIVIRPYVTSIDTDFVNAKVHSDTIGLPNCDRRTDRQTDRLQDYQRGKSATVIGIRYLTNSLVLS